MDDNRNRLARLRDVRPQILLAVGGLATLAALASTAVGRPVVLFNVTASEPKGLYVATSAAPGRGRIIAFRAPKAAFPYADARLSYLRRTSMLKSVAAVSGDEVCSLGGRLRINGRDQGGIVVRDPRGVALPHWAGCRRLVAGELFVFSRHAANSFDSRYFGPVQMGAVIGVYAPFLTVLGLS